MTIETKLWDKEVLVPSLLFTVSICLIIFYPLGYDINITTNIFKNGIYLLLLFFSSLLLFFITNELEFNRKFRTLLLKDIYHNEDRKARALKDEFGRESPYTYIFDKKFNQHMRDEVDKLDLKITLFSNLALVSIVLLSADIIYLVVSFLFQSKIDFSKLIFSISYLILMPLSIKISLDICKRSVVILNNAYIQYIKEAKNDLT